VNLPKTKEALMFYQDQRVWIIDANSDEKKFLHELLLDCGESVLSPSDEIPMNKRFAYLVDCEANLHHWMQRKKISSCKYKQEGVYNTLQASMVGQVLSALAICRDGTLYKYAAKNKWKYYMTPIKSSCVEVLDYYGDKSKYIYILGMKKNLSYSTLLDSVFFIPDTLAQKAREWWFASQNMQVDPKIP